MVEKRGSSFDSVKGFVHRGIFSLVYLVSNRSHCLHLCALAACMLAHRISRANEANQEIARENGQKQSAHLSLSLSPFFSRPLSDVPFCSLASLSLFRS